MRKRWMRPWACALLLLLLPSCPNDSGTNSISVYVVTYTLATQGTVNLTSAEYLAPDGNWTAVPANQTQWADFFTFSGGNKVGFRATGTITGAGLIAMTAKGSSTNNMSVDLVETCTGTTGTTQCNLFKEQVLAK